MLFDHRRLHSKYDCAKSLHLKQNLTARGGAGVGWNLQDTEPPHCCSSPLNLLASLLNVLVGNTRKWQPNNGGGGWVYGCRRRTSKKELFNPSRELRPHNPFTAFTAVSSLLPTIPPSFFLAFFTTIPSSLCSKSGPIFILLSQTPGFRPEANKDDSLRTVLWQLFRNVEWKTFSLSKCTSGGFSRQNFRSPELEAALIDLARPIPIRES